MALTKTPIELSSTPGIVDNSNATAITIDASENVLVGKTALEYENTAGHIFRNDGFQSSIRSGGNVADFNRLSSDGEIIRLSKDGTTVGSIGTNGGRLSIGSGDVNLNFNASANSIYPISDTAGTLSDGIVDVGASTARFKDLYLSGGVNFSANANAGGMTSETLDDYEEGTWTLASTTSGVTISTQSCRYTKVGRLVTLNGAVTFSALPSNISTQHFSGAPFNCWAQYSVGIVREASSTGTAYILQLNANASTFGMNSYSGVANGSARIFAVNESYIFSLTYTIA